MPSKENKIRKDKQIPDNKDLQSTWDKFEDLKATYPDPNLKSVWHNITLNLGWEKKSQTFKLRKAILKYAAVIIPLLAISFSIYYLKIERQGNNIISVESEINKRSKVELPDGSIIWLQPGSKLKYPQKFEGNAREIEFEGMAYFKITKNEDQPFIAHINNMDITVLGTQFYVKANPGDDTIETGLVSGKVKISGKENEHFLEVNDIVKYSKSKGLVTQTSLLSSNSYQWNNGSIIFENCSFYEVMNSIAEWYNLQLNIDPKINQEIKITLTIREESVEEIMEILKLVIPFEFNIENGNIIVFPKGE